MNDAACTTGWSVQSYSLRSASCSAADGAVAAWLGRGGLAGSCVRWCRGNAGAAGAAWRDLACGGAVATWRGRGGLAGPCVRRCRGNAGADMAAWRDFACGWCRGNAGAGRAALRGRPVRGARSVAPVRVGCVGEGVALQCVPANRTYGAHDDHDPYKCPCIVLIMAG